MTTTNHIFCHLGMRACWTKVASEGEIRNLREMCFFYEALRKSDFFIATT